MSERENYLKYFIDEINIQCIFTPDKSTRTVHNKNIDNGRFSKTNFNINPIGNSLAGTASDVIPKN